MYLIYPNLTKQVTKQIIIYYTLFDSLQTILKTNITKAYLNLKKNEEKIISSKKEISATKEALRLTRRR